ncbi:hypothetical protein H696_02604 [Fonticula alba]|uniref:CsbD-like domain-containing protein n=1 Tax=Fonticula alba TaxID=691883 RepID=A0A058Z7J4_FONAL|nr:hypothetical protein H696_02604 [Fonticula alba]KCV70274.1 hypothetical protein H696_02604 [Fonticula alba]|eukprot:XP_009494790.1 hypothetical protein H696_02604 [Fonticula alba]
MSNHPSKISGQWETAKGAVNEAYGKMVGNESIRAQGVAQKAAGQAELAAARSKQATDAACDQMVGTAKEAAGRAAGDKKLAAEGHLQGMKGDFNRATNM